MDLNRKETEISIIHLLNIYNSYVKIQNKNGKFDHFIKDYKVKLETNIYYSEILELCDSKNSYFKLNISTNEIIENKFSDDELSELLFWLREDLKYILCECVNEIYLFNYSG